MLKKVLSNIECSTLIDLANNIGFTRAGSGRSFSQAFIKGYSNIDKLVEYFEKEKNLELKEEPLLRVLKFNKGDSLRNYNFDYSESNKEEFKLFKNTNFGIQIMLNSKFEGANLEYRGKKLNYNTGDGIIFSRQDKANVTEVEQGVAYIGLLHIFNLKPSKNI